MTTSAFLLSLQLGDSGLPTGRFSHSYGLEELLAQEPELAEAVLAEVVESMLIEIVAPLDGVAVAQAHRLTASGDLESLVTLDRAVTVRKITPSSRQSSTACGRRLAALAVELTKDPITGGLAQRIARGASDGNLAVVEGSLARTFDIGIEEAILLELRSASTAMLSAAVRLGRISAMRAQVVAVSLLPVLSGALEIALSVAVSDMRAVGPELDLAAIHHSRREARLFAT